MPAETGYTEDGVETRCGEVFRHFEWLSEMFPDLRVGQIINMVQNDRDTSNWEISRWKKEMRKIRVKEVARIRNLPCGSCGKGGETLWERPRVLCGTCWTDEIVNRGSA